MQRAAREVKDACRAAAKYCQEAGVSLEKLALAFTLSEPSVPPAAVVVEADVEAEEGGVVEGEVAMFT